jgi:hypothetical protein
MTIFSRRVTRTCGANLATLARIARLPEQSISGCSLTAESYAAYTFASQSLRLPGVSERGKVCLAC